MNECATLKWRHLDTKLERRCYCYTVDWFVQFKNGQISAQIHFIHVLVQFCIKNFSKTENKPLEENETPLGIIKRICSDTS